MSGKRILVVDDDSTVRQVVCITLRWNHHIVELASSAEEALTRFEVGKYNLVITDFRMGGMTGLQLAERIKARDPAQRIILMSSSPPCPLPTVFDQVILKPFTHEELTEGVAKVSAMS
jgi:CheY-like chemotaxis protein